MALGTRLALGLAALGGVAIPVVAGGAGEARAQEKVLRRIDGTAWVRSLEQLDGIEVGFLAHMHAEVTRLAPRYFNRRDLVQPEYIVDVAPPNSPRTAGAVMAVGGRIVLHTTLGTVQRFERSGLAPGMCRVWAMANRLEDDCEGFAAYFEAHSPPLFSQRPACVEWPSRP